jgi:hypothetical protein
VNKVPEGKGSRLFGLECARDFPMRLVVVAMLVRIVSVFFLFELRKGG